MMEGFSEIMTLEETAKYLKIGRFTLEGEIPTVKIANQWRFRKKNTDRWIEEHRKLTLKGEPKR